MADIERALVEWLPAATGIEWYGDVPDPRPERFGTVERTGGPSGRDVVIDDPMVAIQVWGKSRSDAKDLALAVRDALPALAGHSGVKSVEITSLYNFPDQKGNNARYQLVAQFATV